MRERLNFEIFLIRGGKTLANIDLIAFMVPETAPKWLNNYGKHVKKRSFI
ncbi:hypothetical protein LACWKB10_0288 [Lactobacillus sp. wkB10]|nr:hypothetical protein LACWKB10_0288 [Lactobacillus sp. wkB10]